VIRQVEKLAAKLVRSRFAVVALCSIPVARSFSSTVPPAIRAPEESVSVPPTVALVVCARRITAEQASKSKTIASLVKEKNERMPELATIPCDIWILLKEQQSIYEQTFDMAVLQ
jgi:hypothetical protein